MRDRTKHPLVRRGAALAALVAVLLVLGLGCGKKDHVTAPTPGTPTPATQLTGVFVGLAENGLLDVTIDAAALARAFRAASLDGAPRALGAGALRAPLAPALADTVVTASGVMSVDGGGVVNLAGTYDTATDSIRLSGSGYALSGLYLPGGTPVRVQGEYTGPGGSGSFMALPGSRPTQVRVFCATYEDSAATMWGTLNLAVAGNALAGFEVPDGSSEVVALQGTSAGTVGINRALAFTSADFIGNGSWNTTTGHVAGVWASPTGHGVWSGDPCLPGTTGTEVTLRDSGTRGVRTAANR